MIINIINDKVMNIGVKDVGIGVLNTPIVLSIDSSI